MNLKFDPDDWALVIIMVICLSAIAIALSMLDGCGSVNTIEESIIPRVNIEEPEPTDKAKPLSIMNAGGPIIVNDIARCINVPPQIVCSLTGEFGDRVYCESPCGDIICVPGDLILCSPGLCYIADP